MNAKVISINVSRGSYSSFVQNIKALAQERTSRYICVANVHMLIEAYRNKAFGKTVNGADIVTPDGVPITWAMRLIHGFKQDRVAGMDLLPDLLQIASIDRLPVFFYGGTQEMIDATQQYIKTNYPVLPIAGMYSPPFRSLSVSEESAVISRINDSGAAIVFVALGCPKQENWMASMKGQINAVMIGVGGALPVMVGMQKRAPKWMQQNGLEWLYRLSQEPSRLFKRYAITNSYFIYLLFITAISRRPGLATGN